MIPFFLAQIQPVEPTVVNQLGQEFVIDAGVLSENGKNIFHTFEQFGLTQEQMANFLANPETENIFNRVNGNDPSFIDGFIKVTGGNPDFYFLNPNGIIFGQHAQINVPAAFYASTATSLQFGNDGFPLYAGPEWFATPFAIGQGIESANGDPTFLIFGAGLHNPILNLGTIQSEKIDLSGISVLSLGELISEDIRFSVGFNSIPWKIATDRDFWTIVPRSSFSSVYPDFVIDVERELQERKIQIGSFPIERRIFLVEHRPFRPLNLFFGLGDTVFNQDVRVFRVSNERQDFFVNFNLAIHLDLPVDLVVDEPVDELPVDLVVDEPVDELPVDLVVDEPVDELPVDLVVDEPVDELPVDLVVDESVDELPVDLVVDESVDELPVDLVVDELVDELSVDPVVNESVDELLSDFFQVEGVTFGFWDTVLNFSEAKIVNFEWTGVCYYPQLFEDVRYCLLNVNQSYPNYQEMTEKQFLEQIND